MNAVDIDQNSARIAAENYKVNGIDSTQYNVYAGDILKDTALAETVGERRMTSLPPISWRTSLSGWRRRQEVLGKGRNAYRFGNHRERSGEVIAALERNGFAVKEFTESEDWAVVTLCHASL